MGMHPMERLLRFLLACECCYDACDCGCALECPRLEHRAQADVEIERHDA